MYLLYMLFSPATLRLLVQSYGILSTPTSSYVAPLFKQSHVECAYKELTQLNRTYGYKPFVILLWMLSLSSWRSSRLGTSHYTLLMETAAIQLIKQ